MALPIKDTPVLSGEDALNFLKKVETSSPISSEEKAQMAKDYSFLESIFIDNQA